jgi:polyvinyl alcohol dehydrogenase (cytochrome)
MLHMKNARKSAAPCGMLSRVVIAALGVFAAGNVAMATDWTSFGGNSANTASNASTITTANVGSLAAKWVYTTTGDVSARAAVANEVAYFPDWGGTLNAVSIGSGKAIWTHQFSDYFGDGVHRNSRTTPAVVKNVVYTATQEGAWLLAINAKTGALIWKTQLENVDPNAIVTSSPTVVNGVVYTGVASVEEGLVAPYPLGAGIQCCIAHGSAVAVNASTGQIVWKTYTAPAGYTGTSIWGSSPVVDTTRNTVFVSTGNNYSHATDPAYQTCIALGGTEAQCLSPFDYVDSILALDMNTGAIKWAARLLNWGQGYIGINDGADSWNVACIAPFYGLPPSPNCPTNAGPDYDFGSGPNLITYRTSSGASRTILGAGQKSGIYYALDPDTGATLWSTQVGPGSSLGGIEWGSASDGQRIYVAISNLNGFPNPAGGNAGSFAALDPATGTVLWQVADPNGAVDIGPMAVSNGVVYGSSLGQAPGAPTMLALNAATGATLWSFPPGSSVNCGATIVDGGVYWGSGYAHLGPLGTGNNKFYAFTPKGK